MAILGVHTLAVAPAWTPAAARGFLPWLKEHGVELMEVPLLRPDEIDAPGTRAVAREFDIRLACSLGLPGAIDSTRDPDAAIAFLARALEVTARIEAIALSGVTYGTIGRTSGAPPTARERDAVARVVEGGARAARERGLRLGVEPCNRYETHLVNTVADAVEVIERVGADNVFVHPDSYHMNIEEAGMARGIADAGRHLGYVHASESNRGVPGRGTLDWAGLCRGLAQAEFEGPVVLESFVHLDPDIAAGLAVWRPVAEHPEEVIDVGLPFLREHASAAGLALRGA